MSSLVVAGLRFPVMEILLLSCSCHCHLATISQLTASTAYCQLSWLVGRLNCCWPSPARSFLVSLSSRSMTKICIFSGTCTCFEMGPPLRWKRSKSKLCYDRRSVGQSALVSSTKFLLLSDICGFVDVEHLLWQEDGFVIYNCCWSSPAQSFSGPSPRSSWPYFTVSDSKLPQPGGPGLRIYIPQEQWARVTLT
jgi:hypothetical protein